MLIIIFFTLGWNLHNKINSPNPTEIEWDEHTELCYETMEITQSYRGGHITELHVLWYQLLHNYSTIYSVGDNYNKQMQHETHLQGAKVEWGLVHTQPISFCVGLIVAIDTCKSGHLSVSKLLILVDVSLSFPLYISSTTALISFFACFSLVYLLEYAPHNIFIANCR